MNLTTTATHDCAVPGCGKRIAAQYLLCSHCWRKLPHALRDEVRSASVGHRDGTVSASDLAAAVTKAVDRVQAAPVKGGGQ